MKRAMSLGAAIVFTCGMFCLTGIVTPCWGITYPTQVGHINDFAGLLDPGIEQQLEAKLIGHRSDTQIEIVVVTTPSLEGQDREAYALGVANQWKTGYNDTGVIMLVAPNEKKFHIHFGDAYPKSWAEKNATSIYENTVKPVYKQGKKAEAIMLGVDKLVSVTKGYLPQLPLGNSVTTEESEAIGSANTESETYVPPIQPGESYEYDTRAAGGFRDVVREEPKPVDPEVGRRFWTFASFLVLFLGSLVLGIFYASKVGFRRGLIEACESLQREFLERFEDADKAAARLAEKHPEVVWREETAFMSRLTTQDLQMMNFKKLNNEALIAKKRQLRQLVFDCKNVVTLEKLADKAEVDATQMLREVPRQIQVVEKVIEHEDVLPETIALLVKVTADLQDVLEPVSKRPANQTDWITLCEDLDDISQELTKIERKANDDKEKARRIRTEVPVLLKAVPQKIQAVRKRNQDGGKYSDVDEMLNQAERLIDRRQDDVSGMSIMDLVLLHAILNDANTISSTAESRYEEHIAPPEPVHVPTYNSYEERDDNDDEVSSYSPSSSSWNDSPSYGGGGGGDLGGSSSYDSGGSSWSDSGSSSSSSDSGGGGGGGDL